LLTETVVNAEVIFSVQAVDGDAEGFKVKRLGIIVVLVVVILAAAFAWSVTRPKQPPALCGGLGPVNRPGCPPAA
jgi:hypothetical protein